MEQGVDGCRFFAQELETLLTMPLDTAQDVAAFCAASRAVEERLQAFPDLHFEGETYHYLMDAAIRQKDAGYRRLQEEEIRKYIRRYLTE